MRPNRPIMPITVSRGLTLVEVLVSLALLASLAAATAAWLTTAHEGARRIERSLRIEAAMEATLDRIGEDVMIGDFLLDLPGAQRGSSGRTDRVTISADDLTVATRGGVGEHLGQPVHHNYRFERTSGQLVREVVAQKPGDTISRVLVAELTDFDVQYDPIELTLCVTLRSTSGITRARSWSVP